MSFSEKFCCECPSRKRRHLLNTKNKAEEFLSLQTDILNHGRILYEMDKRLARGDIKLSV